MAASPRLKAKLRGRQTSAAIKAKAMSQDALVQIARNTASTVRLLRNWDGDAPVSASTEPVVTPALSDPSQQFFSAEGFDARRALLVGHEGLYRPLYHAEFKTSVITDYAELKRIGSANPLELVTMQNGDVVPLASFFFLSAGSYPATASGASRTVCSASGVSR